MPLRFTDLGGAFEAAFDGYSCVVLRQKGPQGPNFHLTYNLVKELLGLFPTSSKTQEPDAAGSLIRRD